MKPLRLLVLASDTFPPERVDLTILYAEELAGRGHHFDWILQSECEVNHGYAASWGGGRVWVAPADRGTSLHHRIHKHLLALRHDVMLFRLLRRGEYDAIEVKDKFLSGALALLAARLYGKRFIYWLSYSFPEHYLSRARDGTAAHRLLYLIRGHVFRILLYRLLLPHADYVFVQSEQMRRDVASQGVPLAKVTAVPMGVKMPALDEGTTPPPRAFRQVIPPGVRCFLHLGSLWRGRRLEFLLGVLDRVREQLPDVRLYFVGGAEDPADRRHLERCAERLGLREAVVFTGHLPREEALRYVRDADVCVSPLYPTPAFVGASPTKLVEYMALGKPVVANVHPEQRLLIDMSGCGCCVPYEERAFADAIVMLLSSPELAREMGERGRRYAREHRSYARIADIVERDLTRTIVDHPY